MEELKRQNRIKTEDSLTGSFFQLLKYLSPGLKNRILELSIAGDNWVHTESDFTVSFWPQWAPTKTQNKNYVEPDVFIEWTDKNLIIEAKYNSIQTRNQWINEIIAYFNVYPNTETALLSIDGNTSCQTELLEVSGKYIYIYKTSWMRLLSVVLGIRANLEKYEKLVCDDIVSVFRYFGFYAGKTFQQCFKEECTILNSSLSYFQRRKIVGY